MPKQPLTKKDLLDLIDEKIQALSLLQSVIQSDRSRKPETFEEYKKQLDALLRK